MTFGPRSSLIDSFPLNSRVLFGINERVGGRMVGLSVLIVAASAQVAVVDDGFALVQNHGERSTTLVDIRNGLPSSLFLNDASGTPSRTAPVHLLLAQDLDGDGVIEIVWSQNLGGASMAFFGVLSAEDGESLFFPSFFEGDGELSLATTEQGFRIEDQLDGEGEFIVHESTLHRPLSTGPAGRLEILGAIEPTVPDGSMCSYGPIVGSDSIAALMLRESRKRAVVRLWDEASDTRLRRKRTIGGGTLFVSSDGDVSVYLEPISEGACALGACRLDAITWVQGIFQTHQWAEVWR